MFALGKFFQSSNKQSSLIQESVNHGQKKFYNIGPWCHSHKTFWDRDKLERFAHNLLYILD